MIEVLVDVGAQATICCGVRGLEKKGRCGREARGVGGAAGCTFFRFGEWTHMDFAIGHIALRAYISNQVSDPWKTTGP